MELSQLLIRELDREAASTRKLLHSIPDGHADWKPHQKSMTLSRMASHVAELPKFLEWILAKDEMDITTLPGERPVYSTGDELVKLFDEHYGNGRALLEKATNEQLMQPWTFRAGAHVILQDSRYDCIRSFMINHHIHHRGQLTVYLRLLDVPYSGLYGPSADDIIAREKAMAN